MASMLTAVDAAVARRLSKALEEAVSLDDDGWKIVHQDEQHRVLEGERDEGDERDGEPEFLLQLWKKKRGVIRNPNGSTSRIPTATRITIGGRSRRSKPPWPSASAEPRRTPRKSKPKTKLLPPPIADQPAKSGDLRVIGVYENVIERAEDGAINDTEFWNIDADDPRAEFWQVQEYGYGAEIERGS
jgi:hypothetical protein